MTIVNCDFCKIKFNKKPSQIKLCLHNYCSSLCQHNARKSGKKTVCCSCNKVIYRQLKYLLKSKSGKYFCSSTCCNVWNGKNHRTNNNYNWTTGESSYREVMARSSSNKQCAMCKKNDIRILSVHHVDHNRKNNILKNLVWVCRNCHHLLHCYKEESLKLTTLLKSNA
jgi:hypothetical protein